MFSAVDFKVITNTCQYNEEATECWIDGNLKYVSQELDTSIKSMKSLFFIELVYSQLPALRWYVLLHYARSIQLLYQFCEKLYSGKTHTECHQSRSKISPLNFICPPWKIIGKWFLDEWTESGPFVLEWVSLSTLLHPNTTHKQSCELRNLALCVTYSLW